MNQEPVGGAPGGGPTREPGASLDDLFTGKTTTNVIGVPPPPRDKKRRRLGGWIAFAVVLVLLGGAVVGVSAAWNAYGEPIRSFLGWGEPKDYEEGMATGEVSVTIVSGDTGASISRSLHEAGVTKTEDAFYDYLVSTGQNPPFVPGVFTLQKQMTSAAALAALLDPANRRDPSVLLREGLTVTQSLQSISDSLGMPMEELTAAVSDPSQYGVSASSLEGWLFPATYTFDSGVSARDVIATLVTRAEQALDQAGVAVADRQRVLTVASIIQREARATADFYKVSRVIENRLDPNNPETHGLLQMDSTVQYGYGQLHDGTVSTSKEARADDNPYNTYMHPGLPVGPIANPGDAAIDAALHPADGPWLYFVTVNLETGETVFSTTYEEHQKAVTQWREWCAQNPGSGC